MFLHSLGTRALQGACAVRKTCFGSRKVGRRQTHTRPNAPKLHVQSCSFLASSNALMSRVHCGNEGGIQLAVSEHCALCVGWWWWWAVCVSAHHNRYRQDWDVGRVETRGVAPSWTPACSTTLLVHVGGQWRAGGSGRRPGPTASPRDVPSRRRSCVWMSVIRFEKCPKSAALCCMLPLHLPTPPHCYCRPTTAAPVQSMSRM